MTVFSIFLGIAGWFMFHAFESIDIRSMPNRGYPESVIQMRKRINGIAGLIILFGIPTFLILCK
jgi:hypothetical protein